MMVVVGFKFISFSFITVLDILYGQDPAHAGFLFIDYKYIMIYNEITHFL